MKSNILTEDNVLWMTKFETAKENLNAFYKDRAKIILHQNRAEEFDLSDSTKIYHFDCLNNYIEGSTIKKLEVDNVKFVLERNICDELFSFNPT